MIINESENYFHQTSLEVDRTQLFAAGSLQVWLDVVNEKLHHSSSWLIIDFLCIYKVREGPRPLFPKQLESTKENWHQGKMVNESKKQLGGGGERTRIGQST